MHLLTVNHDVEDYDRWKAVYDDLDQGSMGAKTGQVNRNIENPNNLTVVHGFESAEAARAFRDSAILKDAMRTAGVSGPPRIEIFEEVETTKY